VCVAALYFAVAVGCREPSPGSGDPVAGSSVPSSRMVPNVLSGAGDMANPEAPTCIRGGTSREDVRRILGEPDSVSFGAWLYGSSEIQFGYGVVVETRDRDGRLRLCD
jgi:outer membrane protein assembly factor BamE (lipoprotein component of BamABCDE complex)